MESIINFDFHHLAGYSDNQDGILYYRHINEVTGKEEDVLYGSKIENIESIEIKEVYPEIYVAGHYNEKARAVISAVRIVAYLTSKGHPRLMVCFKLNGLCADMSLKINLPFG